MLATFARVFGSIALLLLALTACQQAPSGSVISVAIVGGDVAGYTGGDLDGPNAGGEDAIVRKYLP